MKIFDFRSDTLTKPTIKMREVIARAEVGDDVYQEDPSINRLEDLAAEMTGKKAALFLPSGTMGNLIPIMIHCGRGNELICHENSHIVHYELSSISALAGVMPVTIPGNRGIISSEDIALKVRPDIYFMARTGMIEIENSHNKEGGTVWNLEQLKDVSSFAKKKKLPIHMDGARIFNASFASGIPVKKIASFVDTVTFCLSKGLGAPVGAMLCGTREFIDEARRIRKMLGGGMRQAGVLAAAGLYALEHNVQRLSEDHEHAKLLAACLQEQTWAEVDMSTVETNIVYINVLAGNAPKMVETLKKRGILCYNEGDYRIRFVTHLELSSTDIREACEILKNL